MLQTDVANVTLTHDTLTWSSEREGWIVLDVHSDRHIRPRTYVNIAVKHGLADHLVRTVQGYVPNTCLYLSNDKHKYFHQKNSPNSIIWNDSIVRFGGFEMKVYL